MPVRGENIYKRKDGRWEARYIREYREDGSARYGYCYGRTYREAKQKQTAARQFRITPTKRSTEEALSMSRVLDDWLRISQLRVKESTLAKYQSLIRRHIAPYWSGYSTSQLSSSKLEEFAHYLLLTRGLSSKTVRDIMSLLHAAIANAGDRFPGAIPTARVSYPRSERKEIRVLSGEEMGRLVTYLTADSDPCKFGVLLTLMTGIRIGELCALRWGDISLEAYTVRIGASMQRIRDLDSQSAARTKVVITSPKSDSSLRIIPLTNRAAVLCKEYRCSDPDAYVLTGTREKYMEPRTLQYRFQKYTSDCALEGVHLHTLRHTFATRCVEADFEIKALSEILGHSSPKITLERYVHASMQHKRENMRKLDALGL